MPLSRKEIKRRMMLPVNNSMALVVTPLLSQQSVDADSIDLRLGTDFLLSRSDRLPANVPGFARGEYHRAVHVPLGRFLVLPGHQTVLASTLEYIKLPCDLSGMVLTKSSWARTFITVESAPWIHPSFRGCLTLEIANVSDTALVLHPGLSIAQLTLMKVDRARHERIPHDRLTGKYIGPTKPEPAAFKQPDEVLATTLGIDRRRVRLPWDDQVALSKQNP